MHTQTIIIGGGLVGLTAALALGNAGINTLVIESRDPALMRQKGSDGRVSAIAQGSKNFMEQLGIWEDLLPHAGAINDIRVLDHHSSLFVHFDHAQVSDEPMGYMLENFVMLDALFRKVEAHPNITLLTNTSYKAINYEPSHVAVTLDNHSIVTAELLLACDGRFSKIREQAHIPARTVDYHQTAIVCNVRHEKDHQGLAVEHFMPSGPFAILPMHGGYHSSLVWTVTTEEAPDFIALSKDDFTAELTRRFGNFLGRLTLASPVFHYPLKLVHAAHYHAPRLALLGDSAHGIHPIAGQGYNLGVRDVETLAPLLAETASLGLDLGSVTTLKRYEKLRRYDAATMILMTDGLNKLFSNTIVPLRVARRLGLGAVNQLPALKRFFMKRAMGL
jgi:2-octaprenyl-6-methoxyphenol hydroxylase